MKYIIIILLLLPVSFSSFSQKKKKYNRTYTDENFKKIKKENATYYFENKIVEEDKFYVIYNQNVYYIDGNIYQTNLIKIFKSNPYKYVKFGKEIKYFRNGNVKSEYQYVTNEKKGDYKEYYENGVINSKGKIDSFNKIYVFNYYDSTGQDLLVNGTGQITEFDERFNSLINSEVKDSLIQTSFFIQEGDTIYCVVNTAIEPYKGWETYYGELRKSLDGFNLRKFKDGFKLLGILNENGDIEKLEFIKPPLSKYDDLAIERIKKITKFKPVKLLDGRAVKFAFVLPVRII